MHTIILAIPKKKVLPEFGQLILVKSKRDHELQDKGHLAIMMGIYPKISNGIVALVVKEGKLGELCTDMFKVKLDFQQRFGRRLNRWKGR